MNAPPAVLARLFPESTTIERPTAFQDDEGAIEQTWDVLHTAIPSQFSPMGGDSEVRDASGEFVKATAVCYLQGDFDISETDRALTRGGTFDIVSVGRDSYAIYTVLHLEHREPAAEGFS